MEQALFGKMGNILSPPTKSKFRFLLRPPRRVRRCLCRCTSRWAFARASEYITRS